MTKPMNTYRRGSVVLRGDQIPHLTADASLLQSDQSADWKPSSSKGSRPCRRSAPPSRSSGPPARVPMILSTSLRSVSVSFSCSVATPLSRVAVRA